MARLRMVRRISAAAMTACLMAPAAALAADIVVRAPTAPLAPPVLAEDFSSGWYVRGDFTTSLYRRPSARYFDQVNFAPGQWVSLRDTRGGTAFGGGLGLGFKYRWFRLDTTLEIRSAASVSGMAPPEGNWAYAGPLPSPVRTERFGVASQAALVNAYVDLGTFGPVTPYLGAGIGVARLTAGSYSSTPVAAAAQLGETTVIPTLAGTTKWTLAWAGMAGFTIDVTPQTKLDLGYRYLHMGALRFTDTAGGAYRTTVAAHEVRLGLRYMFGDGLGQ
ncbi:porin family protein [Phreatobacter aquaticus]|uniref:Porin family protein n=1 Tax=Phreatobacter aquaticus TaxID=2570229 RepID=A0A4D7QR12_9HYPH|nr:outer membrane beta-barrel protein [Phreatobacter aquaticus]QCK88433.1 porin family protein [Phreatobacter aquaticus]